MEKNSNDVYYILFPMYIYIYIFIYMHLYMCLYITYYINFVIIYQQMLFVLVIKIQISENLNFSTLIIQKPRISVFHFYIKCDVNSLNRWLSHALIQKFFGGGRGAHCAGYDPIGKDINPLTPRRTQVSSFTEISILF